MSHEQSSPEADIAEVTSRLSKGVKTCRAMVANYRTLIAIDAGATESDRTSGLEKKDPAHP